MEKLPERFDFYIHAYFADKVLRLDGSQLYFDNAIRTFFQNYLRDILKKSDTRFWCDTQSLEPEIDENHLSSQKGTLQFALEQEIRPAAQQFLHENEEWVLLYLAHNACLEKGKPLSKLEKIYQIPNYHHKARQLGITRKKGEFENGYEKTLLGKWLLSLSLSLEKDNFADIEVALKILCDEALLLIEND
ncbi:hypothetical protein BGP_0548 [Beggiatoa sp. PS]|nr:hypothetical protein BGP_0548 [Beggiatoa sp. PS]